MSKEKSSKQTLTINNGTASRTAASLHTQAIPACSTPEEALQLGISLGQQGHFEKSLQVLERALDKFGMRVDLLFNRGITYQRLNRHIDALNTFQQILHHLSDFAPLHYTIGISQHELGMYAESIDSFNNAIRLQPNYPEAFNSKGVSQQNLRLWEEAIQSHKNAIDIVPEYADAYNSLGNAYLGLGRYEDALSCFEKALSIQPNHIDAINNKGIAYHKLNRLDEAIDSFNIALSIDSSERKSIIRFNRSLAYLLNCDFEHGWQDYECRSFLIDNMTRDHNWNGQDHLDTIYIRAEQGYGDTIQFVRYLPLVRQYCNKLILECKPELKSLMQEMPEIDEVFERSDNAKIPIEMDNANLIYLLSLPGIFKTNINSIPNNVPYLKAPSSRLASFKLRTQRMFQYSQGVNVGLVWTGADDYHDNQFRSMQLSVLENLVKTEGTHFYSLQKGNASSQLANYKSITDLSLSITDFADTAAVIELLDLVITVDTATAHLAGALGKPVWVLLPFSPDWRWMLGRDDCPWYPTMTLFRQKSPGDWQDAIDRLITALHDYVHERDDQSSSSNQSVFTLNHAA